MFQVAKKIVGVTTLHTLGVIDKASNNTWHHEVSLTIESFNQAFYLRLTVKSKAKNALQEKAIPIKYSETSANDLKSAITFFQQFEACRRGKIGDKDPRGVIARFIDEKILNDQLLGYFNDIPHDVKDIYKNTLKCVRHKNQDSFVLTQRKKSGGDSIVMSIPYTSIAKVISALENLSNRLNE